MKWLIHHLYIWVFSLAGEVALEMAMSDITGQRSPSHYRQYLESEPETGVGQQMNAALHNIFSDAEVGGKLCFHIRATDIFNILTLHGRRDFWRDSDGHMDDVWLI